MSSSLSTLRVRLLKLLDAYNANDLTGTNSGGEVADLCINDALQIIYSLLKPTKLLQSYGSSALSSIADKAYMELSNIPDLDEIKSVKDPTNRIVLLEITPTQYFDRNPQPTDSTGTPVRFCRVFNRIYLDPMPSTAVTYTVEYIKTYPRLVLDGDEALIPSKYDDWIMKEASVKWYMMEDANSIPERVISERDQARQIYMSDVMSQFGRASQAGSHFRRRVPLADPFDHIV